MEEQNAADQAVNENAGVMAVNREECFQRASNKACSGVPQMPRHECLKDWRVSYIIKM